MSILQKRRAEVIRQRKEFLEKQKKCKHQSQTDEIVNLLYSVDEKGRLDLSLGSVLSGKNRPEIRQYVEDHLLRTSMVPPSSCMDADVALENVVPFDLQYGRERDVVSNHLLNQFKGYIEKHKDVE